MGIWMMRNLAEQTFNCLEYFRVVSCSKYLGLNSGINPRDKIQSPFQIGIQFVKAVVDRNHVITLRFDLRLIFLSRSLKLPVFYKT